MNLVQVQSELTCKYCLGSIKNEKVFFSLVVQFLFTKHDKGYEISVEGSQPVGWDYSDLRSKRGMATAWYLWATQPGSITWKMMDFFLQIHYYLQYLADRHSHQSRQ